MKRPLTPKGENVMQSGLNNEIERVYRRQVLFLLYREFRNFYNYSKSHDRKKY